MYEIGETTIAKLGSLAQQIVWYLNCSKKMTRAGPSKLIGPPPLYFLSFASIKKTENKWNDIYTYPDISG